MSPPRSLLLSDQSELISSSSSLEINIGSTKPEVLVAEFQLLFFGLSDTLTLRADGTRGVVRIRVGRDRQQLAASMSDAAVHLTVGKEELAYWQSFLLEYYRDGMGPVDHIHAEGVLEGSDPHDFEVTIRVPIGAPAVNPIEVRRRLGLD